MKRLQNKVAVITGGNSGIGKGIAKHFFQEGAKVAIFGRNLETLNQAKEEIGGDILAIKGDVTKTQDLKNLYETVTLQFGKIDILVVNSGVVKRIHTEEVTEENFDFMVNTNYRGAYFTVRYAIDYCNPKSSIILIGSIAGKLGLKGHTIYGSTKAAVTKLAQQFAYDLADKQIRVNSISPGYIETPIFDAALQMDPEFLRKREQMVPLKRIGTPQDIAHAALFLASEEASYISGTELLVDGGLTASFIETLEN